MKILLINKQQHKFPINQKLLDENSNFFADMNYFCDY